MRSTHGEIVPAPGAGGLPAAPDANQAALAALAANQAASDGAMARAHAEQLAKMDQPPPVVELHPGAIRGYATKVKICTRL